MRLVAVVVGAALTAGCLRTPTYECSTNDQCVRGATPGFCEPAAGGGSYCAFADDQCDSQLRFDPDTPAGVAGTCAGGVTPAGRSHDVCVAGAKFPVAYSSCTQTVCGALPSCCASSWGPLCVMEADLRCHLGCGRQLALAGKGAVAIVTDDDGDRAFTVAASSGAATQFYSTAQWADLDGDATPELVIATANLGDAGDEQWLAHFDGTKIVNGVDLRTITSQGHTPWVRYSAIAASIGDYDKDGYADVAFLGTYPTFQIAHNVHDFQFVLGPEGATGPPDTVNPIADGVGWGDVDGDGDDDLAIAIDNDLIILASDHDQMVPKGELALPGRPYWGAWGDVDGDGKLDLAIAGNGFGRIFRNSGAALDPTPVWKLDGPMFYGGTWIDVDGDGDLDLAITLNDDKLQLYLNTGGVIAATPVWTSLDDNESASVVAADVDGDGDLDLVVANHQPYPTRLYLNDGDQTFSPGTITVPAINYEWVSATRRTPH